MFRGRSHASTAQPSNESSRGNITSDRTAIVTVQETDDHWTTNVSLGNQSVRLCIDTGSSPLWTTGAGIANAHGHSYNISTSPTARAYKNETFFEGFPQSSVSGFVVADTVSVLNSSATVDAFEFGVVDQKSAGLSDQPFDGFLGMGFSNPGTTGASLLDAKPTFFEALLPSLKAPVFAFDMRYNGSGAVASPMMEFGQYDPEYAPQLVTAPIDRSSNRWTAPNITFNINGQSMIESADLVFDTAAGNIIHAPFSVTTEYYRHVSDLRWGSQGGFNCTIIIPCGTALPDLEMGIGNGTARIRGDALRGKPLAATASNPSWTQGSFGLCVPALQPFGKHAYGSCLGIGLIGAPFFREYYTVFNQAEPSVSYAPYQ